MGDRDVPSVGDEVYVHALHRTGLAKVEKVRRDGRLAVRFRDGSTAKVRADQARRTERRPPPRLAPIVREAFPHTATRPDSVRRLAAMTGTPQPKPSTMRDRRYLDWLRSQPCVACGFPHGCDPSHHGRHGLGIKAPDDQAVSMCRRCHDHWELGAPRRVFARGDWDDETTDRWLKEQARVQRAAYMKERDDG